MTDLDLEVPHSARMYDYYLDGKTNYPADREAAEQALSAFPTLRLYAQQNRAFLHRAVRFLAEQAGIDQFLDIGAGIPTQPNLHEVVQGVISTARVVYVDNDPSNPWMQRAARLRHCRTPSAAR
ncbi:SAM-dependent methyltransferase [Frankia sp. AgB1.9]|nr:SAM-dependent methyltransferase [Frankia sp. AgW1.1]MBL7554032.1 SAM-dependent methyltransferase [Frankia sp. AgB1.9]MBL7623721.1 SAM-dependent methyltransferase [Frankia sp. AgB1.8]